MTDNDWWDDEPVTPAADKTPTTSEPVASVSVTAAVRDELARSGQLAHDLDPGPGNIGAINNVVPGIDLNQVDPHPRARRAVNDHRPYS